MNFLNRKKTIMPEDNQEYFPPEPRDLDIEQYAPKEPLPSYVNPRTEVPPVGALSAEALVRDYEKTAKQVEQMGGELAGAARKCADELNLLSDKYASMAKYVRDVTDHVNETAAALRDEAKRVFLQIEDTVLMTKEMRELSEQMRGRVNGENLAPSVVDSKLPSVNYDLIDKVEEELTRNRGQE